MAVNNTAKSVSGEIIAVGGTSYFRNNDFIALTGSVSFAKWSTE